MKQSFRYNFIPHIRLLRSYPIIWDPFYKHELNQSNHGYVITCPVKCGWNYLSITKLELRHHWSICLKLKHAGTRDLWWSSNIDIFYYHMSADNLLCIESHYMVANSICLCILVLWAYQYNYEKFYHANSTNINFDWKLTIIKSMWCIFKIYIRWCRCIAI